MTARRILAALLALSLMMSGPGFAWAADPPPAPSAPPALAGAPVPVPSSDVTPARVSYLNGEVSFWRPGAQDWAPAKVNMPLAPGDVLYTGQSGNVEIQVGPRAFVRASEGTQIGLDNQEPDFVQFRVTAGHAALDLRELAAGHAVELDTPNGAFTVDRTGYYHVEVAQNATTFGTRHQTRHADASRSRNRPGHSQLRRRGPDSDRDCRARKRGERPADDLTERAIARGERMGASGPLDCDLRQLQGFREPCRAQCGS